MSKADLKYYIEEMEERINEPYSLADIDLSNALLKYARKHYANAQRVNCNGIDYICLTETAKEKLFLKLEKRRQELKKRMDELNKAIEEIEWKE